MNAVVVISLPSLIAGDITAAWPSFLRLRGRSLMIFAVYYHRFPVNFTVHSPMPHGRAAPCLAEQSGLSHPGGSTTSRRGNSRRFPFCISATPIADHLVSWP
ncbi:hypothetical protein [Aromatoleum aromaticum]|uniref:hypothetical protein n=1 Tax=Aromatoleum aromaticum TaxID=551760 RepID=UPI0012FF40B0|nr:hypothetical protein [Aromatoleum aromaticum]NMG55779.1 hypothetical protein [Aromatoleum aromaticum]